MYRIIYSIKYSVNLIPTKSIECRKIYQSVHWFSVIEVNY